MQTIIEQAKRLGKMACHVCVGLTVICGVLWGGVAQAQTVTCTIGTVPGLNIGAVDVLQGTPARVSSSFSYSCAVANFTKNGYGQLCFNIGDGSASTGSSYNPRLLQLSTDTTKKLNFDIYQDNSSSLLWGTQYAAANGNPFVVGFQAGNNNKTTASGSLTMYSTVLPLQATASVGTYSSSFTGTSTSITWTTAPSSALNPSLCSGATTVTGTSTFGFTASATVDNHCYVTTNDLNFGSVSSLAAGPITGTSTLNVQCSNGTPYQVGLSNGVNSTGDTNRSMKNTSTAVLVRYDLYQDAARSVRWGNNSAAGGDTLNNQTGTGAYTPITIYGQAYPDASTTAGNYADTVTVTLYY